MIEYPKDNRASFHDTFIDLELSEGLTKEELLWHLLPENIKHVANQWGLSDTPFNDSVWVYYRDLKKNLK